MTTFHIIHVIAGLWLIFGQPLGLLPTIESVYWSNLIVGIVVTVYNLYYLFAKGSVDMEES